jgi:hypothetical protein
MQRSRPVRRSGSRAAGARLRASARAFAANLRSVGLRRAQLSFGGMWASEWAATVALSVVAYATAALPRSRS